MTLLHFLASKENGLVIAGIEIKGTATWGFAGINAGSAPFDVFTGSSGEAVFDPGNGWTGGGATYSASAPGFQTVNSTVTIPPFTNDVTIPITMRTTSGGGSTTESHLPLSAWLAKLGTLIKNNWLLVLVFVIVIVIVFVFLYSESSRRQIIAAASK